jgi:hypothetical protein
MHACLFHSCLSQSGLVPPSQFADSPCACFHPPCYMCCRRYGRDRRGGGGGRGRGDRPYGGGGGFGGSYGERTGSFERGGEGDFMQDRY